MKLHTTVTIRTGWDCHELQSYDMGDIPLHQLCMHLAKLVGEETLVVQIQLWNQTKLNRIQGDYVQERLL